MMILKKTQQNIQKNIFQTKKIIKTKSSVFIYLSKKKLKKPFKILIKSLKINYFFYLLSFLALLDIDEEKPSSIIKSKDVGPSLPTKD